MSDTPKSQRFLPFSTTAPTLSVRRLADISKRLFDLLGAALGLLLLSPVFGLIALGIKRDSPGPVFYRGPRAARGGGVFSILKFRSMYENPESYNGPSVTAVDDPRITPLGKWLRDTKLNELPQLWNVLLGQMSLVGPRPEAPEIAAKWPPEVCAEILSMRPGITSPASIVYRDEESLLQNGQVMQVYLDEIQPSKLRLDQLYVRHHSFWGDLDIIFWTLLVLIPQVRAYTPPEGGLFWGPIARLMRRHVSWFAIDFLITLAAIGLAGLIWRSFGPLDVGWGPSIVLALGFSILFSVTNVILGVNRIRWPKANAMDAIDLLPGIALATTLAMLANYYFPFSLLTLLEEGGSLPSWLAPPIFPPVMILAAAALALLGYVLVRYRIRLITGLAARWVSWRGVRTAQERVLIIGGGETGQYAAWMLNNGRYAETLHVAGFVDDDQYKQGIRIRGVNVLGGRSEIPRLVAKHDIGIIIFAIHNISALERHHLLKICRATPAQVMVFPDIPAALNGLARNGHKPHAASNGPQLHASRDIPQLLPCDLCLTEISPLKVDGWLARLEAQARHGDLEDLLAEIHRLRRYLAEQDTSQLSVDLPQAMPPQKDRPG